MNFSIRPEITADHNAIRRVNRLTFGREAEARLVDALRVGGYVRVSLVAEQDGCVLAHILFSELQILADADSVMALALAPMAVLPEFQRQGVGSALARRGLEKCRQLGYKIVVVVGHPRFYQRFGFSSKTANGLESSYTGEGFMAVELEPASLDGVKGRLKYPPPFGDV